MSVISGGYTGAPVDYTDKRTYADDSVAPGTLLGTAMYGRGATSTQMGWV